MEEYKSIQQLASQIRKEKTDYYCSNIFSVPDEIRTLEKAEGAVAFSIDDKGVERVYFAANNAMDLSRVLSRFSKGAGIEIIGKNAVDRETEDALNESGFKPFAVYLRAMIPDMKESIYKGIPEKYVNVKYQDHMKYADLDDLDDIYSLLYETFSPLTSHLQDREELKQQIDENRFVVSRTDGKLTGLLSYEYQGRKLYMEHMINKGDSVNMHAMYMTVLEKAMDDGINTAYTWMRVDNERAHAFTRRYGYVMEDTRNYVFQKQ